MPARQIAPSQRISGDGPNTLSASVAIKDAIEVLNDENQAPVGTPCELPEVGGIVVVRPCFSVPRAVDGVGRPLLEGRLKPRATLWPTLDRQRRIARMIPDADLWGLSGKVRQFGPEGILAGSAIRLGRGNSKVQNRKIIRNDAPATRVAAERKSASSRSAATRAALGSAITRGSRSQCCREPGRGQALGEPRPGGRHVRSPAVLPCCHGA